MRRRLCWCVLAGACLLVCLLVCLLGGLRTNQAQLRPRPKSSLDVRLGLTAVQLTRHGHRQQMY